MLHAGSAGMVPHHAAGYMEQEVTSSLGCSGFPSKRHKLLRTELAGLGFFSEWCWSRSTLCKQIQTTACDTLILEVMGYDNQDGAGSLKVAICGCWTPSLLAVWKGSLWVLGHKVSRLQFEEGFVLFLQMTTGFLEKFVCLTHTTPQTPQPCIWQGRETIRLRVASVNKTPLAHLKVPWADKCSVQRKQVMEQPSSITVTGDLKIDLISWIWS